ncbi:MAG TPA: DUF2909 domain-containing protein [Steroidobacteraceae bacterium]|nr:DUF2909 domain-containing protein [Steroidobacteraceae bacterium]
MQVIVLLLFMGIIASLAKAMVHMGQGDQSSGMVNALTARIVLSIALFGLLLLGWHFGWIHPQTAH